MFSVNVLTFFPSLFPGCLGESVIGAALREGIWKLNTFAIKDFSDTYALDDTPYGGGSGMVLRPDVGEKAISSCFDGGFINIYPSARGRRFNQAMAEDFASMKGVNILAGRFEGVDERLILEYNLLEVSLGDYVLSSGDVAAFAILDAVVRLLPGVLGDPESLHEESFSSRGRYSSLLEYPHYTKPRAWRGLAVPEVLWSGHHARIEEWRYEQALLKTLSVRPDLYLKHIAAFD